MVKGADAYLRYAAAVTSARALATLEPTRLHWMFGNAMEWTETPTFDRERGVAKTQIRFALGHGWIGGKYNADLAMSGASTLGLAWRTIYLGFRCARSVANEK